MLMKPALWLKICLQGVVGLGPAALVTRQVLCWFPGMGSNELRLALKWQRQLPALFCILWRLVDALGESGVIDVAEIGVLRNSILHSFVLCHTDMEKR